MKPAFGIQDRLKIIPTNQHPITSFDASLRTIKGLVDSAFDSGLPVFRILIEGPSGTGKTVLASLAGMSCGLVRVIRPDALVGMNLEARIDFFVRTFKEAHESQRSCLILKDFDMLIDLVELDHLLFSNQMLQTLLALIKTPPPKERQCLVIATVCGKGLARLGITKRFDLHIDRPRLTSAEL